MRARHFCGCVFMFLVFSLARVLLFFPVVLLGDTVLHADTTHWVSGSMSPRDAAAHVVQHVSFRHHQH